KKFQFIAKHFPKLKLIARGDVIKAIGDEEELDKFEEKIALFLKHFQKYNRLTENNIERILNEESHDMMADHGGDDVLVHGNSGLQVKARTANQRKMVELSSRCDMVFAIGPAGTGKTYTAVALAVRALKQK